MLLDRSSGRTEVVPFSEENLCDQTEADSSLDAEDENSDLDTSLVLTLEVALQVEVVQTAAQGQCSVCGTSTSALPSR